MILTASGLTKRFGDVIAVEALDLEVERGEIYGLVGPDGAGKTTTLRLLCGLLEATAGRAAVAGVEVSPGADVLRDRVGYMPQKFGLYVDLTVTENMRFFADLFGLGGAEFAERATRLLRMTRLEPFSERRAGKLSGGMKQKLALMCTMLHQPELLLLDEPTNGVDPVSRRDFWKILYELVEQGITVVVATAYLDEAERCNHVGLLHQGRLIESETPVNLGKSLNEKCYRLETADRRRAREILAGHPKVLSVESSGLALHLFLAPDQTPSELEELLARNNLGSLRLTPQVPLLEDVFIALVRKQARSVAASEVQP